MPRPTAYSRLQIILHWLVVVLIIGAFLLSDQMDDWEDLPADAPLPLHGVLGLTVFFLMLARLALRLLRGAPPPPADDPAWQQRVAEVTHWALYALAIATPWSGGFAFYLRWEEAADLHELLKSLLLLTAAAHTAAALYHQFILKDGLLARMGLRRP